MSQDRCVCRFSRCDKGTDGTAYVTPEDMEDQELIIMDMRLHTRSHLARVTENKVDGNHENPKGKLEDSKQKIGHYIYNGTKWVKQHMEQYLLVRNLHINVDCSGYKSMGFTELNTTHPQVICGLADTVSQIMLIGPDLAKKLGVEEAEMVHGH